MATDAAELGVDVLDRDLRPGGRQRPDRLRAALLVDEADRHRRERRVGRAGLAVDVAQIVGHRLCAGAAAARRGCRCGGARAGRARARLRPRPR